MVKRRGIEREIEKVVKIGRENARLWPQVQNWCGHLQIRTTSRGMVAEAYRLPVGLMEIVCDHAPPGGMQAMQLEYVARRFIVNNCRNCRLRAAVSPDNVGHVYIKQWEDAQAERNSSSQATSIAKMRLKELVTGDLEDALRREDVTAQSVLDLVALLDDDKHHVEAAAKLVRAAEIAPDLFTDRAVQVICSHFPDPDHGPDCIACVRGLANSRECFLSVALDAARRTILEGHNVDDACMIIGDAVARSGVTSDEQLIGAMVRFQQHGHVVGCDYPRHRDYPGSTHALVETGRRDPEPVIGCLRAQLGLKDANSRMNAAHVIQSLIDPLPSVALAITDALIESLDLDDDLDMDSADATVCETLALIYIRHPDETEKRLEEGRRRLPPDVGALLYRVYRYLARGVHPGALEEDSSLPSYRACIPRVIPILLQAAVSPEYDMETRTNVADALEELADHCVPELLEHLDGLLGMLAALSLEEVQLGNNKPKDALDALEGMGLLAQQERITRSVVAILEAFCESEPERMLGRLRQILPALDGTQEHLVRYKRHLVRLYRQLGTHHDLIPEVIPDLYKPLTDFTSARVRGAAIEAVETILSKAGDVLPQNMSELLIVYLTDSYVYVHKSAVRAISRMRPIDAENALVIACRLIALDSAYRNDEDLHFLRDIRWALLHVTREYGDLQMNFAVPVIIGHCRLPDYYTARDACDDFWRLLPRLPDQYRSAYVREALGFLGRHGSVAHNEDYFSGYRHPLGTLFKLPRDVIAANADLIEDTALHLAEGNAWLAMELAQLLLRSELRLAAARVAKAVYLAQPQTVRHRPVVGEATAIMGLACVEAFTSEGKLDRALVLLEQIIELEDLDDQHDRADGAAQVFAMAKAVADRLAELQAQ